MHGDRLCLAMMAHGNDVTCSAHHQHVVAFAHIPRTGGSSFLRDVRNGLLKNISGSWSFMSEEWCIDSVRSVAVRKYAGINAPKSLLTATFIREPYAHARSMYIECRYGFSTFQRTTAEQRGRSEVEPQAYKLSSSD